jgi:anthranilate phosphoribosyltransferase
MQSDYTHPVDALIKHLKSGQSLTSDHVQFAVEILVADQEPIATKAEFLTALALKGETPEEIAAFAGALRELSIQPPIDAQTRALEILDVCGTGGDRLNTFNISTSVALLVAAAGVPVAKHGNRAITSQCGSADVLEALGIKVDLQPDAAAKSLRDHKFAFFYAPNYHPAFKNIAPVRKACGEKGQRTIFNFLGPLLNPARPSAQLIGVPQPGLTEPMARVLQALGVHRGMVVSGGIRTGEFKAHYLDELSTLGDNVVAEFYHERGFSNSILSPDELPLQPATLEDLAGSDRMANAQIIRRLFQGDERGPKRDAVLLNAAAALFVAGKTKSLAVGWELAGEIIDSGKALQKVKDLSA